MDLTLDLGAMRFPAAFIVAFLLSLYFTPLIRRAAIRYNVLDNPDAALKQHREPIPYLGGIAVFLSFLFALGFTYDFTGPILGILLSGTIIVTLGLFDDLKVLTPGVKLVGQLVAAIVLVKSGVMVRLTFIPPWAALVLTVVWLVAMTNALNLIDVSDGLAAGVSAIAGTFLYVVAQWNGDTQIAMMTLSLVGAALGFLAYNRAPATIFLGDAGSMFLGFMLGALAMRGHYTFRNRVSAIAPAIILGVPLFDTLFVMAARAARRIPLMRGSPDHFAVRLRNHGLRPGVIALIAYVASGLLGAAALTMCVVDGVVATALLVLVSIAGAAGGLVLRKLGRGPSERKADERSGRPGAPAALDESKRAGEPVS